MKKTRLQKYKEERKKIKAAIKHNNRERCFFEKIVTCNEILVIIKFIDKKIYKNF